MNSFLRVLLLLTFGVLLSGCVGRNFTPYRASHQVVVLVDTASLYERDPAYPDRLGAMRGVYIGYGDTITCIGKLNSRKDEYYAVMVSGTAYWMKDGEVVSLYDYAVMLQGLSFRIPTAEDGIAWNRAAFFMSKHLGQPLAVEGEYVLRTESNLARSTMMQVARLQHADSVEYHISPDYRHGKDISRLHLAKQLSYYITTGAEQAVN